MKNFVERICKLMEVKSIVTLAMTAVLAYLLIANVQSPPELLALYSSAYGSIVTYFFTRKDSGSSN